jgi:serine phosphatase RsbU (regulator of sigma subunit)
MNRRISPTVPLFVTLLVLAALAFTAINVLRNSVEFERVARRAQTTSDMLLRQQLDMETGLRGFMATHRGVFLEPYVDAAPAFGRTAEALRRLLTAMQDGAGLRDLAVMERNHARWLSMVAAPTLRNTRPRSVRAVRGKVLVDRMRTASRQIAASIDERVAQTEFRLQGFLVAILGVAFLTLLSAAASIVAIVRYEAETSRERKRDKEIVETLQRAFHSRAEILPRTSVGTAYLSATEAANVGGDLFDVRKLDDRRGYVLIADISGKGIQAAVDTAMIRYTTAALARSTQDPAEILSGLNSVFMTSRSSDTSFLIAFLGVFDWQTLSFRYASAGHDGAFLRRDGDVQMLPVTGPAVGITPLPEYATRTLRLHSGDVVVLATDGFTEARNPQRLMLTEAGAVEWIRRAQGGSAQDIVDELLRSLNHWTTNVVRDDLALLALRIEGVPSAGAADVLPDLDQNGEEPGTTASR